MDGLPRRICGAHGSAKEAAEKRVRATAEAKALFENKALNAALKALLHPKHDFFRSL
jgi:hypothetical protein